MSLLLFQAYAQTDGTWSNSGACTYDGVATVQGIQCLLGNIFGIAITGIGFAAFVMTIVASFYYLLSGSNSKGKENARNTLTYAVIGVVVSLSAFIILNLIAAFTGVSSILEVIIPSSR